MRKSVGVRRGRYNIAAAEKNGIIFKIKKIKQNNNKKIRIGLGIMETNNFSNGDERLLQ